MNATEIYEYLKGKDFYVEEIYDSILNFVKIEIYGDWKHDHLYCEHLMKEIGYTLWSKTITEDTGDDFYRAVHVYVPMDEYDEMCKMAKLFA